jgi:hypothetical protein
MSNIEQAVTNTEISTEATSVNQTATSETLVNAVEQPTTVTNDFLTQLGEELRVNKSLHNFKSADDLAKSYLEANKLLGKRMTELNAEEAQYFKSLIGVPGESDAYKLPDGLTEDTSKWYKDVALKAGLTQDQAKHVIDSYIELERQQMSQAELSQRQEQQAWVESLKKEFGTAFDKQVEIAKRGVKAFGDESLTNLLNETGLGDHPAVVKMFAKIGRELLEDKIIKADSEVTFGVTPADAKRQIDLKRTDAEFMNAYLTARHPGHKAAVAEMARLYELANPS